MILLHFFATDLRTFHLLPFLLAGLIIFGAVSPSTAQEKSVKHAAYDTVRARLSWELWHACQRNDTLLARRAIDSGANVDTSFGSGNLMLIQAIEKRANAVADLLIARGANVKRKQWDGEGMLSTAIFIRSVYWFDRFRELGANVDDTDYIGNPLLTKAAQSGQASMVRRIIDAGVPIDKPKLHGLDAGCTALMVACVAAKDEMVKLLLAHGASVHARASYRFTPLFLAAELSQVSPVMEGDSATIRRWRADDEAKRISAIRIVKMLLEAGASVSDRDTFQRTPLMFAVMGDNLEVVRSLLNAGSDVNAQNDDGETPLMYVTNIRCSQEVVNLLMSHGADPEIRNKKGESARDYARKSGCILTQKK